MRTAKALISLHICAGRSGPSLSATRIIRYYRMYKWKAKARMILWPCAGLYESADFAHVRRHFFAVAISTDIYIAPNKRKIFFYENVCCWTQKCLACGAIFFPFRVDLFSENVQENKQEVT